MSGTFFGCLRQESQNNQPTPEETQVEPTQTETDKSNNTTISQFYEEQLKFALQNGFLDKLKEPSVKGENNIKIDKSNFPNNQLEKMKKIVADFRVSDLSKIKKPEDKKEALAILDRIDQHLAEMSDQVISPLKDGLTPEVVEEVQRNLDFFKAEEISEDEYGNFGNDTYKAIEDFLNKKQEELDKEIQALNAIVNSGTEGGTNGGGSTLTTEQRVAQLEKENQRFKLIFIISGVFGILLIILAIFAFDRNRRMPNKYGKGLSQENQQALSKLEIRFNEKLSNLQGEQNAINRQIEEIGRTIISTEQNLADRINRVEEKTRRNGNNQGGNNITQTPPRNDFYRQLPYDPNPPQPQRNDTRSHSLGLDPIPNDAIEVSETKQSQEDRRLGKSQAVILEKKRRGNYLVYTEGNCDYLVPSENLRINDYNSKSVEGLFECRNYQPNYSEDFQVLKAAVVYTISSGETWELQQRGILQF